MPAIKIENLWKQYRLGTVGHGTFAKDLQSWWAKVRGKEDPNSRIIPGHAAPQTKDRSGDDRFWALQDINLEIEQGEILGIIGRNGAGKSTLLKILSRVTAPTKGNILVRGRIASLLEVGTGFHPELNGEENIHLNAALLGLKRAYVRRKLPEITAFAGIGEFLDLPVKRYSSGMFVRLAFAVAAHVDCDVLLVDEVLAVGDEGFREKCLRRMEELAASGRTVVVVSHDMEVIGRFCTRALLLDRGRLVHDGPVAEGIARYHALNAG